MRAYIRQKRRLQLLFFLILLPLFPESLRNQNKTYFDSITWEELNDLSISPLPQAYTIEGSQPIPYADSIDEDSILPALPQLGVLDYQHIPEDLLTFCDTVAGALTARSIPEETFSSKKPFLPHLERFIIERLPPLSHTFYGRPAFKQDGTAQILFRLSVQPQETAATAQPPAEEPKSAESAALPISPYTESPQENQHPAAAENTQAHTPAAAPAENKTDTTEPGTAALSPEPPAPAVSAADQTAEAQHETIPEKLTLFPESEQPQIIMLELTAIKEDERWKISSIEVKGAEYEDSALKN